MEEQEHKKRPQYKEWPWPTIIVLGAIALIRPILSMFNLYGAFKPAGPVIVTVLIAALWIGWVVYRKIDQPVLALALAGGMYGAFAIILRVVVGQFLSTTPADVSFFANVMIIVMNLIYGTFLGAIAHGIQALLKK